MAPKAFAPLQKVKDAAFEKGGKNLNRYYIARTTDKSLKAISEKIYGKDRSKDLKSWNPSLANRKPKVGDKIYYQSAANPDDTAMMSYYEEAGIEPVTYTSVEGDNIRKLSKSWLGSTESWKEVWSTNASLESKGSIPAGVEIKYWPAAAAAAPVPVAETKPSAKDQAATPPPVADTDVPPPPIDDFTPPADPTAMGETAGKKSEPGAASNPQPASTPDKEVAAATVTTEPPPPPPPPATEQAPPPPPPVTKKAAAPKEEGDDTMFARGVGGVLLMAAAVLFVLVRKNRAKRVDLGQTQV
jgi:hypothetical protein